MCFINPKIQEIYKSEGIDSLAPSICFGNPCVAHILTPTLHEHVHNTSKNFREIDYLDYDLLLKLIGKSN